MAEKRIDFASEVVHQTTTSARYNNKSSDAANEVATARFTCDALHRLTGLTCSPPGQVCPRGNAFGGIRPPVGRTHLCHLSPVTAYQNGGADLRLPCVWMDSIFLPPFVGHWEFREARPEVHFDFLFRWRDQSVVGNQVVRSVNVDDGNTFVLRDSNVSADHGWQR